MAGTMGWHWGVCAWASHLHDRRRVLELRPHAGQFCVVQPDRREHRLLQLGRVLGHERRVQRHGRALLVARRLRRVQELEQGEHAFVVGRAALAGRHAGLHRRQPPGELLADGRLEQLQGGGLARLVGDAAVAPLFHALHRLLVPLSREERGPGGLRGDVRVLHARELELVGLFVEGHVAHRGEQHALAHERHARVRDGRALVAPVRLRGLRLGVRHTHTQRKGGQQRTETYE
jgi:hypothetical protein